MVTPLPSGMSRRWHQSRPTQSRHPRQSVYPSRSAHVRYTKTTKKTAKKLDAKLGTNADATGPDETEMNPKSSRRVSGFVVGAFGEVSKRVRDVADLVACELNAEHLALFDGAMNASDLPAVTMKQQGTKQLLDKIRYGIWGCEA